MTFSEKLLDILQNRRARNGVGITTFFMMFPVLLILLIEINEYLAPVNFVVVILILIVSLIIVMMLSSKRNAWIRDIEISILTYYERVDSCNFTQRAKILESMRKLLSFIPNGAAGHRCLKLLQHLK